MWISFPTIDIPPKYKPVGPWFQFMGTLNGIMAEMMHIPHLAFWAYLAGSQCHVIKNILATFSLCLPAAGNNVKVTWMPLYTWEHVSFSVAPGICPLYLVLHVYHFYCSVYWCVYAPCKVTFEGSWFLLDPKTQPKTQWRIQIYIR